MVAQVGYSVARRSRGRVALCAVCAVHMVMARVSWLSLTSKVDGLSVVWPQNHSNGFHWFGLKTSGDGFLQFDLKTGGDSFSRFDLKIGGWFLG
jgi:hypothetical protein